MSKTRKSLLSYSDDLGGESPPNGQWRERFDFLSATDILRWLQGAASSARAVVLQRFFKTGAGEYGAGDVFLGIGVPELRRCVRKTAPLPFSEIRELLMSRFHEARAVGVLLLVAGKVAGISGTPATVPAVGAAERAKPFAGKVDAAKQEEIFNFYLECARLGRINNWDLVDVSCKEIVGRRLLDKRDRSMLVKLAKNGNLWEQRIAIVSTGCFITHGQFDDTLKIAKIFFTHPHDLIHKATGWMLREVGKKERSVLREFLTQNGSAMPRTALRHAIEHFAPAERAKFLQREKIRTRSKRREPEQN
ncbi:MAG: DNA alkylation repair protein [Puniceicoccales bacterium]|jgi:3-methyladenine DNA glycosylase AlkD|nr:DNA alkylation repair protein [Puniceicoccales bacterium]